MGADVMGGVSQTFLPLSKHTRSSERLSVGKKFMVRTSTSLSTVRIYDNRLAKQHVLSDKRRAVAAQTT